MKKSFMHAIIGSSGRDSVLIVLFQLSGSKAGFLKVIYSGWVNMTPPPQPSKSKNCWHYHIDADVISFFCCK